MNAITKFRKHPIIATAILIAVVIVAVDSLSLIRGRSGQDEDGQKDGAVYVCPMLCVPPSPKPGKCSVCGMNLERVDGATAGDMARPAIALSERSLALLQVETATIEKRAASAEINLSGKVAADETRMFEISARVPGRIERLSANFTGMKVKKGDPLLTLYSPQLLSAQEELLQAGRSDSKDVLVAAREKLRLLGISGSQIATIEKSGKATDHMTFNSPVDGTIIKKDAVEGSYVKEGTKLYTIADLTRVWVLLDAYESDVAILREGQNAIFTPESLQGSEFSAKVSFIDPVLNERTRIVAVRLEVDNQDGRLKPGAFVRAKVKAELDAEGRPVAAGAENTEVPLIVPASAPLLTGTRAVVYVATETDGEYEGREVVLGPRVGDDYIVLKGLSEGDRVVVNGNFRIDSALQIMGRPSMMTPAEPVEKPDISEPEGKPQTTCPIMGGAINKDVYADHNGYRVYFCCPGCDTPFMKDADALIKKMQDEGIILDRTPAGE